MKNNVQNIFKEQLKVIILILFSLQIFSCNSSENAKDKKNINNIGKSTGKAFTNNSYFPVAENMSWEYINEAPRVETELFNVNITSLKNDNGSILTEFDAFPFFSKTNEKTTIRISKTGEVYVKDANGNENLFLPEESKLTKGSTWMFGDWSAYVTDSLETVKTEKGTYYNCLHIGYGRGGITFTSQLWFAKDAGIVKWTNYRTNPPARVFTYYVLK